VSVAIIFETHAPTVDNEAGIATGWLPGRLSPNGRSLATELGQRHRDEDIDAVFVSDLRRAIETAEVAFAGRNVPVHQDARLRECNYGALNGEPVARLSKERSHHVDTPFPGGQSYREVVARTRSFLRDLAADFESRRVLVIAHSANRWALDCLLKGARLEDLVDAPFTWQAGWLYTLPTGWTGESGSPVVIAAAAIDSPDCQILIAALDAELTERYPEAGANHFRLDPEEVSPGRGVFLLADIDGAPAGCGAVRQLNGAEAEIKRMYVAPHARGQGVGRALLTALEDEARRLGVARLVLETGERQPEALGLSKSAGFAAIPLFGEYVGSRLSVCMAKELAE
jgi:broad specificity phosphatase PhoE/GNAT superfamily N-acetyltransferase